MKRCKSCSLPIAFSAGLIVASVLPTKAVCVIAAIVLTQVARRLSLPYPAMLAAAGAVVAAGASVA